MIVPVGSSIRVVGLWKVFGLEINMCEWRRLPVERASSRKGKRASSDA